MWAQFRLGLGLVVRFYDARHDSQHYTIPRCLGPPHPTLSVSTRHPSLIAQHKLANCHLFLQACSAPHLLPAPLRTCHARTSPVSGTSRAENEARRGRLHTRTELCKQPHDRAARQVLQRQGHLLAVQASLPDCLSLDLRLATRLDHVYPRGGHRRGHLALRRHVDRVLPARADLPHRHQDDQGGYGARQARRPHGRRGEAPGPVWLRV